MIVVSDTNILSSLAAGDSLTALLRLFARSTFCIPPSVRDELQVGLNKGRSYLEPIFHALTQKRNAVLLSNDRRALRYCQQENLRAVNLIGILRLLWARQIMSQDEVRILATKMEQVENLVITPAQRTAIFAPRSGG